MDTLLASIQKEFGSMRGYLEVQGARSELFEEMERTLLEST